MRDLLESVYVFDVVNLMQGWTQTTMDCKGFVVDYSSNRKEVKHICELLPDLRWAVLALTLCIKTIYLSDLSSLVVATQQADAIWISNFKKKEQSHCFNAVLAAINIVTKKEVVNIWNVTTNLEELYHVPELAVDIAYQGDGTI